METTSPRAQTLALQGVVNLIMRGALRVPGLCRLVGRRLLVVHVVGRTSGRRYSVPVAYTRHDGHLLIGTPFGWGRNLRTGSSVDIRVQGKRLRADVEVVAGEADVIDCYTILCRDNHQFAKFNNIGLDVDGTPSDADLRLAWSGGACAFRLRPP